MDMKKRMGRPPKFIDVAEVKRLISLGVPKTRIANSLKVSVKTLDARLK